MTEYPNPDYYFKVEYGKLQLSFQEISGLPSENSNLENGLVQPQINCRRGICLNNKSFRIISNNIMGDSIIPITLNISLLNSNNEVIRSWQFMNAYPIKLDIEPLEKLSEYILLEHLEFQYTMATRTL